MVKWNQIILLDGFSKRWLRLVILLDEEIEFLFECLDQRYGNYLDEKEKQSYLFSYCENNCINRYKSIQNHNYIGTRGFINDNELLHQLNQGWTISYPENGITLM